MLVIILDTTSNELLDHEMNLLGAATLERSDPLGREKLRSTELAELPPVTTVRDRHVLVAVGDYVEVHALGSVEECGVVGLEELSRD